MKILGIVGSPRKGGNTDTLIDRALEGAAGRKADVEKIYLRDYNISPCQGGFTCEVARSCAIPDDMQRVYAKLREAAGVIVGVPVYMSQIAAPLLNFLDRCRPFISYIDALGLPGLSPAEEKAVREAKTCLQLWKGKPYSELPSPEEKIMDTAVNTYVAKNHSHPTATRRLGPGKKGAIIICYGQHVEDRYPEVIGLLTNNLKNFWGLELVEVMGASGVVKKGDVQTREDLLTRAFQAGQRLADARSGAGP